MEISQENGTTIGTADDLPPVNRTRLLDWIASKKSPGCEHSNPVLIELLDHIKSRRLDTPAGNATEPPATDASEPPDLIDEIRAIVRYEHEDRIRRLEDRVRALETPTPLEPLFRLEEPEAFPGHAKILALKIDAKAKAGDCASLDERRYWQGRRDAYGIAMNIVAAAMKKPADPGDEAWEHLEAAMILAHYGLEEPINMYDAIVTKTERRPGLLGVLFG